MRKQTRLRGDIIMSLYISDNDINKFRRDILFICGPCNNIRTEGELIYLGLSACVAARSRNKSRLASVRTFPWSLELHVIKSFSVLIQLLILSNHLFHTNLVNRTQ